MSSPTIDDLINQYADQFGVPRNEAHALAQFESGKNQKAVSKAGAIGVMQLMPGTARGMGLDPHDLAQNIRGGLQYYANARKAANGDPAGAYAYYNGGPGGYSKWRAGKPLAETASAVPRFLSLVKSRPITNLTPQVESQPTMPPVTFVDPYEATRKSLLSSLLQSANEKPVDNLNTPNPALAQSLGLMPPVPGTSGPLANPVSPVHTWFDPLGTGLQPAEQQTIAPSPAEMAARLRQRIADNTNPYGLNEAQNDASLKTQQALLDFYGNHPVQTTQWEDYTPPAFPFREQPDYPDRPAPSTDTTSSVLGALAGILDPHNAGRYNSAPIEASITQANRDYEDRLARYRDAVTQANQTFEDALLGRDSQVKTDLYNRAGQQRVDEANSEAESTREETTAKALAAIAGASAMGSGLQGLTTEAQEAAKAQTGLDTLDAALRNQAALDAAGERRFEKSNQLVNTLINAGTNAFNRQLALSNTYRHQQVQEQQGQDRLDNADANQWLRALAVASALAGRGINPNTVPGLPGLPGAGDIADLHKGILQKRASALQLKDPHISAQQRIVDNLLRYKEAQFRTYNKIQGDDTQTPENKQKARYDADKANNEFLAEQKKLNDMLDKFGTAPSTPGNNRANVNGGKNTKPGKTLPPGVSNVIIRGNGWALTPK